MPESLREALEDVHRKLITSVYQKEEHVRLSLVARVAQAVGWDIWNPAEVNTEFVTTPDEDRTKVDMALFAIPTYPSVLIEIKAVGKMEGNLTVIETQVRDYNRNITAPFSVITDGKIWRFYYVKGEGTFGQKLFDKLDLSTENEFKLAQILESYLSKTEIKSGNAEAEARKRLNVTQEQETMANSFAEAEARTKLEPYPTLPDALIGVMQGKGFEITGQKAVAYIRSKTTPPPPPLPPLQVRPDCKIIRLATSNKDLARPSFPTDDDICRAMISVIRKEGGSSLTKNVLKKVYDQLEVSFDCEYWQRQTEKPPHEPRWRNKMRWLRLTMINEGLLRSDSKHGWWELPE